MVYGLWQFAFNFVGLGKVYCPFFQAQFCDTYLHTLPGSADAEINPFDFYALEAAVQIKDKLGGVITGLL